MIEGARCRVFKPAQPIVESCYGVLRVRVLQINTHTPVHTCIDCSSRP